MALSAQARRVNEFYDATTEGFYLAGWDPEHIHLGIFDQGRDELLEHDPKQVILDRPAAVMRMTTLIVDGAGIAATDLVVDAGCGVGGTSLYAAERYGCTVVGLNINRRQIAIARRRARERGLTRQVSFKFCDCSVRLPFADGSVDAIVTIESACHYADRPRFLAECARVLRPGGRLVGQDWMGADTLSDADQRRYLAPLEAAWYLSDIDSLASYRAMLKSAGLKVRHAAHIEDGIRPNGYLMRLVYHWLLLNSTRRPLTDDERVIKERFRTFFEALLGGYLKVGEYVAQKPRTRGERA
jgi:cyclopropane fatty-acyl-phospholipid synthase-like methyltransferase